MLDKAKRFGLQEWRALQPALDGIEERVPLALELFEMGLLFGIKLRQIARIRLVRQPIAFAQAEEHFKLAELKTLKSRSGQEKIAKLKEIQRCHRLEQVYLLHRQLENLDDALLALDDVQQLFLGHKGHVEIVDDGVQLVIDLLKPQFVHLVDDNEEHFVVGRLADLDASKVLGREDLIQLQVLAVMHADVLLIDRLHRVRVYTQ